MPGPAGDNHFMNALTGTLVVSGTNSLLASGDDHGPSQTLLNVISYQTGSVLFVTGAAGVYSSKPRVGINTDAPDHELAISGAVSASLAISASAFYGDGANLTGIGAGGLFTAIDGSNAYITSSVTIGGTGTPVYTLDVAGNAGFNEYIYHNGDTNTFIRFEPDEVNIEAGGENMIYLVSGSGGDQNAKATINNDQVDVDFQVKGDNEANLIRTVAISDMVGIGHHTTIAALLHVSSSADGALFRVDTLTGENPVLFVTGSSTSVGINTGAPDHELAVSGNISASVNISASAFYGDGSTLSNISATPAGEDTYIQFNNNSSFGGVGHLTTDGTGSLAAAGNISSSADGRFLALDINSNVNVIDSNANFSGGNVTSYGTISGSGELNPGDGNRY